MADDHRFGILGGSFNPPHVGHLRLAVEVLERLGLPRLEFMPCYRPPHKEDGALLPFALRARCLALALGIQGGAPRLPGLELNTMEQERPGPSYTIDTLAACRERDPGRQPCFILGAGDLLTLETWKQGLELPFQATLVVVPREGGDLDAVRGYVRTHWPEARQNTPPEHALAAWSFPPAPANSRILTAGRERPAPLPTASPETLPETSPETSPALPPETSPAPSPAPPPGMSPETSPETSPDYGLIYLPVPRMDVSGAMIRRAWVEGRILRGLMPECVELELLRQERAVSQIWGPRGGKTPRG